MLALLLTIATLLTMVPTASAQRAGSAPEYCTLTIGYYIEDTETKIAPTYKASLPAGSRYDVESPTVVGYKVADDGQQIISGTLNVNATVRVDYTTENATASYTINYIGRSIDGTVKETLFTFDGTDAVGEIITAEDKTFPGYVRDPGALNLKITGDGNAELNVYYTETVKPCIVFSTGGTYVPPIVIDMGTNIEEETAEKNEVVPERPGYIFQGWDWNGDGVHDDNDQPLATTPENDLVIKAIWTPGTSEYIVEYYFQDTDGNGYTRNDSMDEVRQAETESIVTATEEDEKKGETIDQEDPFFGFDYSHCEDTTVTGDGLAILKLYYNRERWTINLHNTAMRSETTWGQYRDEILPKQDQDIWKSFTGLYGSPFPDDFPTVEELEDHYKPLCPEEWTGYLYVNILWAAKSSWRDSAGLDDENEIYTIHNYDNRVFDVEDTPGSREINVYPFYAEARIDFRITSYFQDLDDPDTYTDEQVSFLTQDKTESWYNIPDTNEGFTIVGGSYRSKKTEKEWPEPGDPPLNYDKVIPVPDDEDYFLYPLVPWNLGGVTYTPAREGYTFTGWYLEPELKTKVTFLWLEKDVAVYAGWEPDGSGTSDDSDRKYALHFVTNGGTSYIDKGYDPGTTVTLDQTPEREGYIFTGWYSDPELKTKIEEVTMERDTVVYAGWEAENPDELPEKSRVYDLHFVLNGGVFTYETIVESPTGHWTPITSAHKDEETSIVALPTEIYTETEVRFIRLKFDLSFYSDNKPIAGQAYSDIPYETPLEEYLTYKPSDELAKDRTFLGWCLSTGDELPNGSIEMVDENITMPAANVYLHAVWQDPQYTVTFDSRGGTEVPGQTVDKGTAADEPTPPTKDGCTFVGWYDKDGNRWSFDQDIYEDTTLHAVWRQEGEAGYRVEHIVEGEDSPFYIKNGTGKPGDTIIDRALGMGDDAYQEYVKEYGEMYLVPDYAEKSLVLKEGDENVIVFYYSPSPTRDYTVHYYEYGTNKPVAPDKVVNDTDMTVVTEGAQEIHGYELVTDGLTNGKYQTVELVVGENNEIIFYYKLSENTAVIAPAAVTIYMGGEGYDGAIDEDGQGLTSSNGFPVPGFTIAAPDGVTNFDPTEAKLKYDNEAGDVREWNIVPYDNDEDATHGIYRFEPTDPNSATAVRMQFIESGGTVVTQDDFVITDHLDQDLTMEVYGESIDHGYVTLKYKDQSYTVAAGTAILTIRSTTNQVQYGDVVENEAAISDEEPGVVAPSDTVYYINNDPVKVVNTSAVKLLFDDIIETGSSSNAALLKAKTDAVLSGLGDTSLSGGTRHYQCKYLDLVDNSNGNVWVAASNTITVYWPLPEGTDQTTGFELLHYTDPQLHREEAVEDIADIINASSIASETIKRESITNTGTHIKFDVPRAGFSPFVLVWETQDAGTDPDEEYTLHYVSNGGTPYEDEHYPSGTVVDLSKVPIREGYTFTGWYADPELTEKITSVTMTSDKTVYAGWKYTDVPDWLNGDDHFAYIIGYPDGTVQPTGNITRAEVAAVFFRLLKEEVRQEYLTDQNDFNDVLLGRWYNINVSTMASLGIVAGRPGGDFDPNAPITRAEFAAICARFDTTGTTGISQFTDIEGHWAQEEIQRAAALGWILGYPDNTFRPDQYITRAEAMTTINRVLQRLPENETDLLAGMNVWPDNQPGAWYYLAVQEATNTHDFIRKDNFYERWTQMLEDPNWVQYQ